MKKVVGIFLILFLFGFVILNILIIKKVIVLPASPERCAKLRTVLSNEQIAMSQDYWDRRCGFSPR